MKYLVVELQTFENGSMSTPAYAYDDRLSAEAKYYSILSVATKSALPIHACVLITNDGRPLMNKAYTHAVEVEPETEETPEETE